MMVCTVARVLAIVIWLGGFVAETHADCQTANGCYGGDCDSWSGYLCTELEDFACDCTDCFCVNDPVVDGNYCNDGTKPTNDDYLGDGYCDANLPALNSANCNWDNGDCCVETCVDAQYVCGEDRPYECLDSEQTSYYSCQATCYGHTCDYYENFGLSCWAMENQYACNCNYCNCTVQSTTETPTTQVVTDTPECPVANIGDGLCDTHARGVKGCNTAAFGYDGGDCCASTCDSDNCGATFAYDCQDPDASREGCNVGSSESLLGDGYCHSYGAFNTAGCNWDGGDCCADTCVDSSSFLCGEDSAYYCLNPDSDTSHCNVGFDSRLGDGKCDTAGYYNTMACGWDGGDCCESTCRNPIVNLTLGCTAGGSFDCDYFMGLNNETLNYTCRALENFHNFDCSGCLLCEPPCNEYSKVCLDPAATDFGSCQFQGQGAGDGVCDDYGGYNTKACGWDGGDCCDDTCTDPQNFGGCFDTNPFNCDYYVDTYGFNCSFLAASGFNCGGCTRCAEPCTFDSANKVCRNPKSNDTIVDQCTVAFPEYIGDDLCDQAGQYNTEACNWDGGDCCRLSCLANHANVDGVVMANNCNASRYKCVDPQYNCVGEWSQWGNCDVSCGGGTKTREFVVSQIARSGGVECAYNQSSVQVQTCSSKICDADGDGVGDDVDSCELDDENDADSDSVCGNQDDCPYDADDDIDADAYCGDVDSCPLDDTNDFDSDEICSNIDSCPLDPDNDVDGDAHCVPEDACPDSVDVDSDYLCADVDSCPLDAGNDFDSDNICGNIDSCPRDSLNDVDGDGICDDKDLCVAFESKLGDHICDSNGTYNTKACGWDGGDCCEHTCRESTFGDYYEYEAPCSSQVYACLDPLYADCTFEFPSRIGDGHCDIQKRANTQACNWDGGDCCPASCVSSYYGCGADDYSCEDPDNTGAGCNVFFTSALGDGYCDGDQGQYNTAACGWDGGDCCAGTCNQTAAYPCGHWVHFQCLDPAANSSLCTVAYPSRLGDGICDMGGHYNTAVCSWDGGDCCPDTCVANFSTGDRSGCGDGLYQDCDYWINASPDDYSCAILQNALGWDCSGCLLCDNGCGDVFSCQDPNSSRYGVQDCIGVSSSLNNGKCDLGNENTKACGWDGGDCCNDTCTNALCEYYDGIAGHVCNDPNSTEFNACSVEFEEYIADGMCDGGLYNTAACDWDGGDCCELSCFAEESPFSSECGSLADFECQNPAFGCTGAWTQWSTCDASCGTGSHHRTFLITRNATGGGVACENEHTEIFVGNCNTQGCDFDADGTNDDLDSCPVDAENDADSDAVCGNVDECPYDAADDSDADDTCDSDDSCPLDPANDFDGDALCSSFDSCPEDPYNDADSDNNCDTGPACGADSSNDIDSDEICADEDSCPMDAGNDIDSDQMCQADDPCPTDPLNDSDSDGICDTDDNCLAVSSRVGDGFCDALDATFGNMSYNTAGCGWDGGDCCSHSCRVVDAAGDFGGGMLPCDWILASPVYACVDPLFATCDADIASYVGDGYCDDHKRTNTEACNWDGGDCCASTCDSNAFYSCGNYDYKCKDPDANNDVCTVAESYLNDGYCDDGLGQYNSAACGWDGGDCCSSTCVSTALTGCGHYAGFICLDPEGNNTICNVGFPSALGDGFCDLVGHYNTASCNWDNGDCCADTCTDCTSTNLFACLDPNASSYGDVSCSGAESWLGDGYCDTTDENSAACGWDGGDCCEDTCACTVGCFAVCGEESSYFCQDPNSSSFDTCGVEYPEYIGDGACDQDAGYNTDKCGWDGGDCCELSCIASPGTLASAEYQCGTLDYDCKDPKFSNTIGALGSNYATIGSGLRNDISDACPYCSITGGAGNQIYKASYGAVLGGLRNAVFSKHSAILGGFENVATGRLSTVIGGSRNTVAARHSAALGFQARVKSALSLVAAFHANLAETTDQDAQCLLEATEDSSIKLCADNIFFNDLDLLQLVANARRLSTVSNRATALAVEWKRLTDRAALVRSESLAKLRAQSQILAEQRRQLSTRKQKPKHV